MNYSKSSEKTYNSSAINQVNNICKTNYTNDETEDALETLLVKYSLSLLSQPEIIPQQEDITDELKKEIKSLKEEIIKLKDDIKEKNSLLYGMGSFSIFTKDASGKEKTIGSGRNLVIEDVKGLGFSDIIQELPLPSHSSNKVFRGV